jgi:hypothetical protein
MKIYKYMIQLHSLYYLLPLLIKEQTWIILDPPNFCVHRILSTVRWIHLMKPMVQIHLFCRADDVPPKFNCSRSPLTVINRPANYSPLNCFVPVVAFSSCSETSRHQHLLPHASWRHRCSSLNPLATPDAAPSSRPSHLLAPFRPAPSSPPI